MDFYERIDEAFKRLNVNRAEVGRELGMTGQGVTMKLKRKSRMTEREIEVLCRYAGLGRAEALGDGSMVLDKEDEQDLVEMYRLMTPEQKERFRGMVQDVVGPLPKAEPHGEETA